MIEIEEGGISILVGLIEKKTGYNIEDLKSSNRKREIVHARRIFFVICRKLLVLSFSKIGNIVNKNHPTVMHGLNKHNTEIGIYKDYSNVYDSIYQDFKILYIEYSEKYNVDYMKKQINILKTQRNFINKQIKEYWKKIKKQEIN